MTKLHMLLAVVLLGLCSSTAEALPPLSSGLMPVNDGGLLVEVATRYQKAEGRRFCSRRYGSRLAYVTFKGSNVTCHFRQSNTALRKQADRQCRKDGFRLQRVKSIRIKGNRSITRFVCMRRR
jgi:hypothetical protein